MFRFKQFDVDQTGCAMKINTDGVLLGALADANHPKTILDIGTGTGVIALMLAQRFPGAQIDAVEIDEQAAQTGARNFTGSPFAERLTVYPSSFADFFDKYPGRKYDLIVSNPPFYINSLKSPKKGKEIAKHADRGFFEMLIRDASLHLSEDGVFCLILPVYTAELVLKLGDKYGLFPSKKVMVRSFAISEPHRMILFLELKQMSLQEASLSIYKAVNIYSEEYVKLLQPYFIAF
ncbi:MAG TPA: methyltransferase [Mucilaginibacter sp.]|jgi:tRNA1Val (adenine37-N6)-methyltransferase|nr:methyltransferase [Mucilaginibacter sp.]